MRFCFEICAEGTVAEGAALDILEPLGKVQCRVCRAHFEIERPFGRCVCGQTDLAWISGEAIRFKELELA